jgi:hypothetical protein
MCRGLSNSVNHRFNVVTAEVIVLAQFQTKSVLSISALNRLNILKKPFLVQKYLIFKKIDPKAE